MSEKATPQNHQKKDVSHLKGKQKKYYNALMQAREIILQQFKFHSDEALKFERNSSGERTGVSTHMADHGSDNFIHDMELGLLTNEGDTLELIEEAIQRLLDDEFGECQDCGCTINEARLDAMPYARFCVECKTKREQGGEEVIA